MYCYLVKFSKVTNFQNPFWSLQIKRFLHFENVTFLALLMHHLISCHNPNGNPQNNSPFHPQKSHSSNLSMSSTLVLIAQFCQQRNTLLHSLPTSADKLPSPNLASFRSCLAKRLKCFHRDLRINIHKLRADYTAKVHVARAKSFSKFQSIFRDGTPRFSHFRTTTRWWMLATSTPDTLGSTYTHSWRIWQHCTGKEIFWKSFQKFTSGRIYFSFNWNKTSIFVQVSNFSTILHISGARSRATSELLESHPLANLIHSIEQTFATNAYSGS